jgi:hypothetical protein
MHIPILSLSFHFLDELHFLLHVNCIRLHLLLLIVLLRGGGWLLGRIFLHGNVSPVRLRIG